MSVKLLGIVDASKAESAIGKAFGPFVVGRRLGQPPLSPEHPIRAMVFLPPQFHVLLRFNMRPEGLVVDMACDYWPLLSHLIMLFVENGVYVSSKGKHNKAVKALPLATQKVVHTVQLSTPAAQHLISPLSFVRWLSWKKKKRKPRE